MGKIDLTKLFSPSLLDLNLQYLLAKYSPIKNSLAITFGGDYRDDFFFPISPRGVEYFSFLDIDSLSKV
ncbi:MAG: hypothetical protein N3B16_01455 [Candidatus Aminicenantes bacterium]|nr:hypothetical protein [Candidatus Aminicenantes bacterium]